MFAAVLILGIGAEPVPTFSVENKVPPSFAVTNRVTACPCATGCPCEAGQPCTCGAYCSCPACQGRKAKAAKVPPGALRTTTGEWIVPDPARPGYYVPLPRSGVVPGVAAAPGKPEAPLSTRGTFAGGAVVPSRSLPAPAPYRALTGTGVPVGMSGFIENCGPLG